MRSHVINLRAFRAFVGLRIWGNRRNKATQRYKTSTFCFWRTQALMVVKGSCFWNTEKSECDEQVENCDEKVYIHMLQTMYTALDRTPKHSDC
jgi:hypothetical protein